MVKNRRKKLFQNLCLEFSFAFIAIVPPLNIYNRGNLQIEKRFFEAIAFEKSRTNKFKALFYMPSRFKFFQGPF